MSAGAPRITNRDLDRQQHAQAAHIHALAARRVPEADIAAATGCTLARVRQVLTQPAPDTSEQGIPQPRQAPAEAPRGTVRGLTLPALLDAATGHDDARIARLADHITGDLNTLRALLAAEEERAAHTQRIRAINTRLANLHTRNAAAHRRRTDEVTA